MLAVLRFLITVIAGVNIRGQLKTSVVFQSQINVVNNIQRELSW